MTTTKTLIALARRFAERLGATRNENLSAVNLTGAFGDGSEQEEWATILSGLAPAPFTEVSVRHASHSEPLEPRERHDPAARFLITLHKTTEQARAWFVFADQALTWLSAGGWAHDCRIAALADEHEVRTRVGSILRWEPDGPAPPQVTHAVAAIDPVAWVRDLTGRSVLAPDILRWMPVAANGAHAWSAWAGVASVQLARALCNKITPMRENLRLEFTGPPVSVLVEDTRRIAGAFAQWIQVAEWVFLSPDIEVRHGFFSGEFARVRPSPKCA